MSLNSIRASDASKDFTLRLDLEGWTSLATVAGKKAVTLDVVTANDFCFEFIGYFSDRGTSKEMMDGIFGRFPRLKFIRFLVSSAHISCFVISSFLDTYQVQH